MPSTKPGPFPYIAGRTLYCHIKRFLDSGTGTRVQVWSKTANNWVTFVQADWDNYSVYLVPEDYPTNSAASYCLHSSNYPTWDLEQQPYLITVYEEDPTDATYPGTGTASNPTDQAVYNQVIGAENGNLTSIYGTVLGAANLSKLMQAFRIGTVVANGGNTASTFKTDLEQLGTDYYNNRVLAWPEGTNNETQESLVTAFDNTTQFITVSPAFTNIPTTGHQFIIGGRIN